MHNESTADSYASPAGASILFLRTRKEGMVPFRTAGVIAMTLIKKYGNRRLYDTAQSRYITLEELADQVRNGADVRVVDAKTDSDLTQSTLAQIILESRGGSRLLPVPLLVQLIRMGDEALAEFFGRYVSAALELYVQAKAGAQAFAPINPFATLPFTATSALARLFSGAAPCCTCEQRRRRVAAARDGRASQGAAPSEEIVQPEETYRLIFVRCTKIP
jgi:polyhydroxyalkanoate synthesis repressor PhaR